MPAEVTDLRSALVREADRLNQNPVCGLVYEHVEMHKSCFSFSSLHLSIYLSIYLSMYVRTHIWRSVDQPPPLPPQWLRVWVLRFRVLGFRV